MWLSAWVVLCACAALAAEDARRACNCSGLLHRTADCSHRQRSSFGKQDLCSGRTNKLDLSHNNFTAFPTALGAYVTHVNISHNQLTALPRAPPLNAHTHTLDVSFNRIDNSSDELRALSSLHVLDVSDNRLRSLGFLPEPCALRRLGAQRNLLQGVPDNIDRCQLLMTLDLSDNPLVELPAGAFANLGHLLHLHVAHAQIQQLNAFSFIGLDKLKLLDLAFNKLPAVNSDVFLPLKELKQLYLESNAITEVLEDAFKGLSKLEVLRLTSNYLQQFPQGVFVPMKNLKYLLLNENHLTALSSNVFSGLEKIQSIALNHNRLETLPARLFAGLRTLRNVALAGNGLTELPSDMLSGVDHLHLLDLHKNRLSALPDGLFQGVRFVKVLDLSHNRLASFSGRFLAGLGRVERLDLQHNALAAVPAYSAGPGAWPAVGRALLGGNRLDGAGAVTEAQLRAWMGSGHERRALDLGATPPLRALHALRWALSDHRVLSATRNGCACGFLKMRYAEVSFCTAVQCPGAAANWMQAARAASNDSA